MKRLFSILALVLIIGCMTFLTISAATTYTVIVYEVSQDNFVGVRFREDGGTWTGYLTSGTHTTSFEFTVEAQFQLSAGSPYTGAFLEIYRGEPTGVNLASQLTGLEPDQWGNIYIENTLVFPIYMQSDTFYLNLRAVNYNDYVDNRVGYGAGLELGQQQGYTQCYNELYLPLKNAYDELVAQFNAGAGVDVEQIRLQAGLQGYSDGMRDSEIVPNVFKSIFNAMGRFFGMVVSIKFLGIPLYSILLIPILIPLTIKIVKVLMHGG